MPIVKKIEELRELIQQHYGVRADISISVHGNRNPHITKEMANDIVLQIAANLEQQDIYSYANHSENDYSWVSLRTWKGLSLSAFYNYPA